MVLATSARGEAMRGAEPVQRPVADQIADVGRDPVGAGLDELVVVELIDGLFQRGELARNCRQQSWADRLARAAASRSRCSVGSRL